MDVPVVVCTCIGVYVGCVSGLIYHWNNVTEGPNPAITCSLIALPIASGFSLGKYISK